MDADISVLAQLDLDLSRPPTRPGVGNIRHYRRLVAVLAPNQRQRDRGGEQNLRNGHAYRLWLLPGQIGLKQDRSEVNRASEDARLPPPLPQVSPALVDGDQRPPAAAEVRT